MSRSLPQHLVTLLLLAMAVSVPASLARSAPPATLKYEGNLMTAGERPLATGQYSIRFALYTSPAGGEPIWTEVHTKVLVKNGAFEAVLGKGDAARPLDLPFDRQYYLGVSVDDEPELVPRVELMPTPYSFHARHAEQVSDGSVTSAKLAPGAVTDDKIRSVSWNKITGVNGTAGVPAGIWSLKGNSSSDPGVDFIGTTDAADLTFRTNNAPRFSIRSGGDGEFFSDFHSVGRITSRPSQGSGAFLFGDQTVGLERPGTSSNLRLFGPSSGSFVFDGGNVGIGASNPASKLEVAGGATLRENLQVDGRADVTGAAGVGGTLSVGGATTLQGALQAAGATSLGGTLAVGGRTSLGDGTEATGSSSGALVVAGGVGIGKSLQVGKDLLVAGATTLTGAVTTVGGGAFGSLTVAPGSATIAGDAAANKLLAGAGGVSSGGPVVVDVDLDANGDYTSSAAYPLRVQGSAQGIWIEVNGAAGGTPNKSNDFLAFVGKDTDRLHGRISGLTGAEQRNESEYKWEQGNLVAAQVLADLDFAKAIGMTIASAFSTTTCLGFGACQTFPIVSIIIQAAAELILTGSEVVLTASELDAWQTMKNRQVENGGVCYSSAAADYAEWLPKADASELLFAGDVVGVRGGRVSKRTDGAEMLMVVSTNPMVLGNIPPQGREAGYVKVAFMGQVPVKVFGRVEAGDFVLASGQHNGFAVARPPAAFTAEDHSNLVGIAWSASDASRLGYVNVAVGLDRQGVARLAKRQEESLLAQARHIDGLRLELQRTHAALASLLPGYRAAMLEAGASPAMFPEEPVREPHGAAVAAHAGPGPAPIPSGVPEGAGGPAATSPGTSLSGGHLAANHPGGLVSRVDLEEGITEAIEYLRRSGATSETNLVMRKLSDAGYRQTLIAEIQARVNQSAGPLR